MRIIHVNPTTTYDTLRSRNLTQVVVAHDIKSLIVLSGQLPLDPDGRLVGKDDIVAQTTAVYESMKRCLEAVGASLSNVLRMNAYITDLEQHPPLVRKVRAQYFGTETPPASTMIEVPRLPAGVLIEVDALAGL